MVYIYLLGSHGFLYFIDGFQDGLQRFSVLYRQLSGGCVRARALSCACGMRCPVHSLARAAHWAKTAPVRADTARALVLARLINSSVCDPDKLKAVMHAG